MRNPPFVKDASGENLLGRGRFSFVKHALGEKPPNEEFSFVEHALGGDFSERDDCPL